MANKFKVGDIVIGNEAANHVYGVTTEGSKLKVTRAGKYNFSATLLYAPLHTDGYFNGREYILNYDCFDLVTEGDKIVITTDGVTTTAKMYCSKKVIKKAEAKCAPGDKFDFEFGARLAMDRLVEDTKKKEKIKKELIDLCGTKIGFKNTRSFSFTGMFDGTKFLEAMKVKKTPKVLSIEDFDWIDFKKGECAIMIHSKTAYDEMLRRIKRRFCPEEPLDISGYYRGYSGYLYYGRDEKLRFIVNAPDIDYIEAYKFFKKRINMTDDDWKAFDNSDTTLHVTEDVEDDILLVLKCLGYTWRNGKDMTCWTPGLDEYYLTKDETDGSIGYMYTEGIRLLMIQPNHVDVVKLVKKV